MLFDKTLTTLLECPGGEAGSYLIPNGVTSIGNRALASCTRLTDVMVLSSVTNIAEYAFYGCSGLSRVIFYGNAPGLGGTSVFSGDTHATAYYMPGTAGWSATYGGIPTAMWYLPYPVIVNNGSSFGGQSNRFGFTIAWATNISVVTEACTNLANPVWQAVQTNALAAGTAYFSDAKWTNYPCRFYRVRTL